VSKIPTKKTEKKKDWALTEDSLNKLLSWLETDAEKAGEKYETIRHKLIIFFTRERCMCPEDQADETLDRVARKLTEKEALENAKPEAYIRGVAHNVLKEDYRRPERALSPLAPVTEDVRKKEGIDEESARKEALAFCCDNCLKKLPVKERDILLKYYEGERGLEKITFRKELAKKLSVSPGALIVRVLRYRKKFRECVDECLAGTGREVDWGKNH
jgi:DNA-directed RNA polymerase specialized sigma24 family protein